MIRHTTVALTLLISGPALADDKSKWIDDAYSLFESAELDLIREAVKEVIEELAGDESDKVMLAVCDDFVSTYEQQVELEKALNEAAEETIEEVVENAFEYFYGEHVARNGDILDRMLPTEVYQNRSTDGWICNYEAPPCGSYSEDTKTASNWGDLSQRLQFKSKSSDLRVCYQVKGKDWSDDDGRVGEHLFVRTESDSDCDGTFSVHEQHVYMDYYDYSSDYSDITTTLTTEATEATVADSSTAQY